MFGLRYSQAILFEGQEIGSQISFFLVETELLSNVVSMAADRIHTDVKELGYLFAGFTLLDKRNDLHFLGGKVEKTYSFGKRGNDII